MWVFWRSWWRQSFQKIYCHGARQWWNVRSWAGWWCFRSNDLVSFGRNCFYALVAPNTASVSPFVWVVIQPASQPEPHLSLAEVQESGVLTVACTGPLILPTLWFKGTGLSERVWAREVSPLHYNHFASVLTLRMARADSQHGLQTERCFQTTATRVAWQAFGCTEGLLFPGTAAASFTVVLISAHILQPSLQVSLMTASWLLCSSLRQLAVHWNTLEKYFPNWLPHTDL